MHCFFHQHLEKYRLGRGCTEYLDGVMGGLMVNRLSGPTSYAACSAQTYILSSAHDAIKEVGLGAIRSRFDGR